MDLAKPKPGKRLYYPVLFGLIAVISAVALLQGFISPETHPSIAIAPKKKTEPVIVRTTESYNIVQREKIEFTALNSVERFFVPAKPHDANDHLLMLFLLVSSLVMLFIIRRESRKGMFHAGLSAYTRALGQVAFVFLMLLLIRDYYFDRMVQHATENVFRMEARHPYTSYPAFWVVVLLGPISYILKQGEEVQKQKDILQQYEDQTI